MKPARTKNQNGFSLVELMVALVLGVILTGGVISVYITSKNTYNVNNGLGQVEEGGRFALNFMQPLLTMAGYTGCSRPGSAGSITNLLVSGATTPPVYDFYSPVFGYEANNTGIGDSVGGGSATTPPALAGGASDWSPSLTYNDTGSVLYSAISGTLVDGSDVLMVHAAGSNPAPLVGPTYDDGTLLYITPSTSASAPVTAANFSNGEIALASTCDHSSFYAFQISAVGNTAGTLAHASGGTPGNVSNAAAAHWTGGPLPSSGSVQPVQTYAFYVGRGQDGWPALYEANFITSGAGAGSLQTEELVSGTENMQVLYGVDVGGDQIPDQFLTASDVQAGPSWDKVVSVRVALVMQSDDNSIDNAPAAATVFHMLGSTNSGSVNFTPPVDRRMRRYFIQTFSFRNLLP